MTVQVVSPRRHIHAWPTSSIRRDAKNPRYSYGCSKKACLKGGR